MEAWRCSIADTLNSKSKHTRTTSGAKGKRKLPTAKAETKNINSNSNGVVNVNAYAAADAIATSAFLTQFAKVALKPNKSTNPKRQTCRPHELVGAVSHTYICTYIYKYIYRQTQMYICMNVSKLNLQQQFNYQ